MNPMTIGQLARAASVNVETIRYYERIGMLQQPDAPVEGWRTYDEQALRRVRFVKRAQAIGLSLDDARQLLDIRQDPTADCSEAREIALAKLGEIEAKIRALTEIRDALLAVAEACPGSGPPADCPILDAVEPASAAGATPDEERVTP